MSRFNVSIAEQRFGFRRREARENTVYPAQMQSVCVSAEAVGAIHQTVERWPAHPLVLVDHAVVVLDPPLERRACPRGARADRPALALRSDSVGSSIGKQNCCASGK
jgi:hypothetical protein